MLFIIAVIACFGGMGVGLTYEGVVSCFVINCLAARSTANGVRWVDKGVVEILRGLTNQMVKGLFNKY